jgi:hypothetical protein
MQEMADWLSARPPEYAGPIAENGFVPHLTDQDLKDIGVLLGHRRKILAAAALAERPRAAPLVLLLIAIKWWN